jgi:membrane associated rhomboid family serine protease
MAYPSQPPTPDPQAPVVCYRHPDRRAGVRCQRCERPICPSCMTQASVGFHCPECVHQGAKRAPTYTARTMPGFQPVVTYGLIAVNVAVFVAQLATIRSGENPLWGVEGTVGAHGDLFGPAVGAGEWWRLVTSGFMHGGIPHVGMNMYVLYVIGPQLERLLGSLRFAGLYAAALLAGSLGVMILSPFQATLGASGAIFGLLGAAAAFQLANHINLWASGLGRLILLNLVITFSFSSFISVGGHLGGLIGGAVVGWVNFQLEQRQVPAVVGFAASIAAALVFGVVAFALAPTGYVVR